MSHYRSLSTSGIPSKNNTDPLSAPKHFRDEGEDIVLGVNVKGEMLTVNSRLLMQEEGRSDESGDIVIISPISVQNPEEELDSECRKSNPNSYRDEWRKLFDGPDYLSRLRAFGLNGQLRSCRFRSICWRLYLECLPEKMNEWLIKTREHRSKYQTVRDQLSKNPRTETETLDLSVNNPLSQEEQSPWNQYFQDSELKVTISQDVIRTFPEIDFFHTSHIQEMMVNILFCFAREHPHITYKQGMHELLAPLIFVLHSDQQAFLHASEIGLLSSFDVAARDEIQELLDPVFIEHDAYFMFSQVMETVESWYLVNDNFNTKSDCFNSAPFSRPPECGPSSSLGVKLMKIHEQLLQRHDTELFSHLVRMEIVPQIYGIRWLRLLFGREFAMQDLLVIWDAIFADSISFSLVDYIFTAMLIFIRELLLSGDYTACLSYLMRYPAVVDVHYIIDLALHLRNPMKNAKPVGYTSHAVSIPTVGGHREVHRAPQRPSANIQHARTDTSARGSGTADSAANKPGSSRPRTLPVSPFGTLRLAGKNKVNGNGQTSTESPDGVGTSDAVEVAVSAGNTPPCKVEPTSENGSWSTGRVHIPGHTRRLSDVTAQMRSNRGLEQAFPQEDARDQASAVHHLPGKLDSMDFSLHKSAHLSLSLGQLNSDKDKAAKEMELEEEVAKLKTEMSERQVIMDYCWRRMTRHLEQLQECMLQQQLKHEDEMLLSLAGLKRVRDILKGNLRFSEVTDDEDFIERGLRNMHITRDDDCYYDAHDDDDIPQSNKNVNESVDNIQQDQNVKDVKKGDKQDVDVETGLDLSNHKASSGGLAVARSGFKKLKNSILSSD